MKGRKNIVSRKGKAKTTLISIVERGGKKHKIIGKKTEKEDSRKKNKNKNQNERKKTWNKKEKKL